MYFCFYPEGVKIGLHRNYFQAVPRVTIPVRNRLHGILASALRYTHCRARFAGWPPPLCRFAVELLFTSMKPYQNTSKPTSLGNLHCSRRKHDYSQLRATFPHFRVVCSRTTPKVTWTLTVQLPFNVFWAIVSLFNVDCNIVYSCVDKRSNGSWNIIKRKQRGKHCYCW